MFNVDFVRLLRQLTPHFLRGVKFTAWITALVKPLGSLNEKLNSFRNLTNYKLLFTAQIIYLEHYLNDQFDQITRGIFITNIEENDFSFIFNVIELQESFYLYNNTEAQPPVYFYNTPELLTGDNYIVNVPASVVFTETNMRAKINFYNNAGKNYSIITY